jgi:hypothetical protein
MQSFSIAGNRARMRKASPQSQEHGSPPIWRSMTAFLLAPGLDVRP